MKVIEQAIRFPVTTAVGVILIVLFGVIALDGLPVQLTPNVDEPVITVITRWAGASPLEVEREIINEQEEQLKSLDGLVKLESQSSDGNGTIVLTFQTGTDLDSALLKASNALEQVPAYPADADKPVLRTSDPTFGSIAWFILLPLEGTEYEGEIWKLYDYLDDFVKPEFERVPGVALSNIYGGREREMHVIVDPAKLAARRVTFSDVGDALERENRNYTGGDFDEGKRRYLVRTVGEYRDPGDIDDIVVAVRNDVPVYLRDLGHAELGYRKARAVVFNKGEKILAVNAQKEPGTNIFEVMDGLKRAQEHVNRERLAQHGVYLRQVFDQTEYISSAIDLVQQSLIIGGILAIVTLLVYLRSGSSTLIIAAAIPISIVGSFIGMYAFGRSLNVISLAGMAFAVGMVVDNSIVVLENIYRHRQMGKSRFDAAHDGAREVWGAVLASTLTTIAVFIPVVFMQEEVGQLFGDIALAISCAVGLSLLVAITVIPSLSAKILRAGRPSEQAGGRRQLWGLASRGRGFTDLVSGTVYRITGSTVARLVVVVGFTVVAVGLSYWMMPKREYLPLGNQNFLFGFLLPPPGYSLQELGRVQDVMTTRLEHLWEHPAGSPEAAAVPGGGIDNYFFVALTSSAIMGARANAEDRARELLPEFTEASRVIPGSIFVMTQRSLFQSGRDDGRNVELEITGPELEQLIALGSEIFGRVFQELAGVQARPIPSLDLGNPEVRLVTNRRRAAELGLSNRELGFTVSALVDGAIASDYQYQGQEIDLRLKAGEEFDRRTHLLEQLPIATPQGSLVTLGSVADLTLVQGPVQINHSERERTISIQVTPAEDMELETAVELIQSRILEPMRQEGKLGGLYDVTVSGSARKLAEAIEALRWDLILALIITYLLMAALFESFLYPLVILFSVPLATFGGFLGLRLLDALTESPQPLDVLTMLGFIILVGTVVNNAILIVHQSLNNMRNAAMAPREAIRESVRTRMRPIFMSVSTSALGMLPLILFPGAGSELYRGLGSVVVGGLVVSTVFTLFLVPALFSLSLDARSALVRWLTPSTPTRETVSS